MESVHTLTHVMESAGTLTHAGIFAGASPWGRRLYYGSSLREETRRAFGVL